MLHHQNYLYRSLLSSRESCKTLFSQKLLAHLDARDSGFTLTELLIVIVIIGILSAIAIPSMLSQANKARQTEAKTNISAINRAQQLYFLQNAKFTHQMDRLELGISDSTDYTYSITNVDGAQPADPNDSSYQEAVVSWAFATTSSVSSYLGIVDQLGGAKRQMTLICEQQHTSVAIDPTATSQNYSVSKSTADAVDPICLSPFQPLDN